LRVCAKGLWNSTSSYIVFHRDKFSKRIRRSSYSSFRLDECLWKVSLIWFEAMNWHMTFSYLGLWFLLSPQLLLHERATIKETNTLNIHRWYSPKAYIFVLGLSKFIEIDKNECLDELQILRVETRIKSLVLLLTNMHFANINRNRIFILGSHQE
jgi:hypothetical protein